MEATRSWRDHVQTVVDRGRRSLGMLGRSTVAPPPEPPGAEVRSGWWDLLPFTAHNIELAAGIGTNPGALPPTDDLRIQVLVDACGGSVRDRRVLDLGCLEGGYTLALAALGAEAVGIEAREISIRRCELAKSLTRAERASFVHADLVDELTRQPAADAVLATGILYHFADPFDVLRRIRTLQPSVLLIDTHVASDTVTHNCSNYVERMSGGYAFRGRLFHEFDHDISTEERDAMVWAAWSDEDAFWPTEDELVRMIELAGFDDVRRVDNPNGVAWQVDQRNRVMYLATSGADHVEPEPEGDGDLHRVEGDETTGSG